MRSTALHPCDMQVNPDYVSWLRSLPLLECERLLGGNWKIRPAAGLYFKRGWCAVVDEVPADLDHIVRYWDLAATEKTEFNAIPMRIVGSPTFWSGGSTRRPGFQSLSGPVFCAIMFGWRTRSNGPIGRKT